MSSRRHRVCSPLDVDDLLREILLRLPPQPCSLPRASLVCKRWRRLVSDPGFFRRFLLRHRSNPPLLGFFDRFARLSFLPTLEGPNRVPRERFSFQCAGFGSRSSSLGCRDGLMLLFLRERLQVLVWDPLTGDQHRVAIPAAFDTKRTLTNGAVLRAAGDAPHFRVALVVADGDDEKHIQALACVYSSETGLWGNLISTPVQYQASDSPYIPCPHHGLYR
ncbi:putative F-box protein [Hordeum vulgare]|nr:putative F-box protein [Hordeum vulgare]